MVDACLTSRVLYNALRCRLGNHSHNLAIYNMLKKDDAPDDPR